MERKDRMALIKTIEENCNSRLLIYLTGDRRGMETKIATDVFPMFHRHLMQIGHQKRIDLFLYSTGGITIAGYALVNLIREFCDEFNVIIVFKTREVLNLNIVEPGDELTRLIVELFNAYNEILKLDVPYNPETVLGTSDSGTYSFNRGIIESHDVTHVFRTTKELKRIQVPQSGYPIPVIGHQERVFQEEWIEDNII